MKIYRTGNETFSTLHVGKNKESFFGGEVESE